MKKRYLLPAVALVIPVVAFAAHALTVKNGGSVAMQAATLAIKARGKPLADPDAFRVAILKRAYPSPAPIPAAMQEAFDIHEIDIDGHKVIVVAPKSGVSRWNIIYNHGGAYVNDLVGPHWDIVKALVQATGATVTVPIYPLAPEFNNRQAYPFLANVYRSVLSKTAASSVVLAGDSAGGGLAIGEAIEFKRLGLPAPARIIAFSPWLDLTLADPAARAVEPHDIMLGIDALRLCGNWWAAGDDPKSPRLSPLYADLKGFPPIDIYQGTEDLLVVDARTFAAKAKKAGTPVHYGEYNGAFHVFVGATFTPEAKDVFARIRADLPSGTPVGTKK